jgi:hypothetical protein
MCRCTDIMLFQTRPYKASRQLLIPRIAAAGTSFSPLPCQAWYGYQRPPLGGRGRCRRACERTPLRGRRRCAASGHRKRASFFRLVVSPLMVARSFHATILARETQPPKTWTASKLDNLWTSETNWCKPPWSLLPDFVQKLCQSRAANIIITPY